MHQASADATIGRCTYQASFNHEDEVTGSPVQAISKEDDWTGTTDAAARRKVQTRLNTRAYRE